MFVLWKGLGSSKKQSFTENFVCNGNGAWHLIPTYVIISAPSTFSSKFFKFSRKCFLKQLVSKCFVRNFRQYYCTAQKSFPLRISSVNVIKFAGSYTLKIFIFWNEAWLDLLPQLFPPFEKFLILSQKTLAHFPTPSLKIKQLAQFFRKKYLLNNNKSQINKIFRESQFTFSSNNEYN